MDPAEDFDRAIVGVAERIGMDSVVVYDKELILKMLCKEMPSSQAVEYFEFKVLGSYVGEKNPSFLDVYGKIKIGHNGGTFNKKQWCRVFLKKTSHNTAEVEGF